ncbi:50S ribosomal protein L28 [Mycoplasmopsis anatis]|uniref:Large ribosomal subunit protein bL28 n=3 Tax=Mycoplasmatota TaxID=544448 RepID=F9QEF2_9BACT|nr:MULTISPECIES: 50S ribosomal protein L28 [Mycoplasmatota]AWX70301.1 50S ribosomal protein L28 [Mycoplasmopsis anatis]EGS28879.1 50S ribosomal protein L28 [Mycoplasmopsis anatis 1340]MBW0594396.1 50S ribosomal protein L28 [Mycoplasmopsis anatis]MBW0595250.1 50S ribosomal protein L28 [Mycoplasmopsis anatis]MBW0596290.1 50S ribosomal protein L28 [Mycoplasmopsis anatis]
MSRRDQISGKGPQFGNKRSHAMNASRRKFNVNLQKVKIKTASGTKTLRVSAKTIKTLKKNNVIA